MIFVMQVRSGKTGQIITLEQSPSIGKGGEGTVHRVIGDNRQCAKIYTRDLSHEQISKLQSMLRTPPTDPMRDKGYVSIAWPTDLLHDFASHKIIGFMMPLIEDGRNLFVAYNTRTRRQCWPDLDYQRLVTIAHNLCVAVEAIHANGHVIGDLNQKNVLVSRSILVTIIDTDSFQVRDHTGKIYRCCVGTPEFTPPELQGQRFDTIDRASEHDCFALGVHLFMLLMQGHHPFSGSCTSSCNCKGAPTIQSRIKAGCFFYSVRKKVIPPPTAVPFDMLHPQLQGLFLRCFEDSLQDPAARPSAQEWRKALEDTMNELVRCSANPNHFYWRHYGGCVWCKRARQIGQDEFPYQTSTQIILPPTPQSPAAPTPSIPSPQHLLWNHLPKMLQKPLSMLNSFWRSQSLIWISSFLSFTTLLIIFFIIIFLVKSIISAVVSAFTQPRSFATSWETLSKTNHTGIHISEPEASSPSSEQSQSSQVELLDTSSTAAVVSSENHYPSSQEAASTLPFEPELRMPDVLMRKLSEEEVKSMTPDEIQHVINGLFAWKGYEFPGDGERACKIREYFSGKSWYKPRIADQQAVIDSFNEIEKYNFEILVKIRNEKNHKVEVFVCEDTGMLAKDCCPKRKRLTYSKGEEPVDECNEHNHTNLTDSFYLDGSSSTSGPEDFPDSSVDEGAIE